MIHTRIAAARTPSREVGWAYRTLAASGGQARVTSIARDIGWSRKHLAARFTQEIGCGPKTVARIMRFNRAASLARTTDESWAGIAADCGYADQAHLIREFRDLAGDAPTDWRTRPEFVG
jgi:transcriptional regulator GlxA family with amidase domain